MRRIVLVLVMAAVMMALSATAALFTVGPGGDIGVVAVGGEERGGVDAGLL